MRLAAGSGALRSGLPNAWRSCPRRRKKAESGEPGTAFTRRTGALRVLAAAGRRAGVRVEGLLAARVAGVVRRLPGLVVRVFLVSCRGMGFPGSHYISQIREWGAPTRRGK